jgi:hypothetical protein
VPLWPALELVLLGHATLGEICGGPPTMEDARVMSIASRAWRKAESQAERH